MLATDWIDVFTRIPPEEWQNLSLMLDNNMSIGIKEIVQTSDQYVLLKGRTSGTMDDANRVFCVPYDSLCYLYFTVPLTNERALEIFGGGTRAQPAPRATERPPTPEPTPRTAAPAVPDKSAVSVMRERLRARLAAQQGSDAKPKTS